MQQVQTFFATALMPIVVGITGHRDLHPHDIDGLKKTVRIIFCELRKKYPNSPLVLLSPLAEGADRLVAEVALEMNKLEPDNPIKLIVPMPFHQSEYEKDFEDPTSLLIFREILGQASKSFTLNSDNQGNNIPREQSYFEVGKYIVEKSQLLIALWDGVNNCKKGGTSDIVQLCLTGNCYGNGIGQDETPAAIDNIFNPIQTGVVYHVVTRRVSNEIPTAPDNRFLRLGVAATIEPCSINDLYPQPLNDVAGDTVFDRMLKCRDDMNEVIKNNYTQLQDNMEKSSEWLIPEKIRSTLPDDIKHQIKLFSLWDAIAMFYQKKNNLSLIWMASIIPLLALAIEIYKSYTNNIVFVAVYLVLLSVAFALYKISDNKKWLIKYIDSRALAEGLRVSIFWRIAGINKSAADYYINRQRSEAEWIRDAIRGYDLSAPGGAEVDNSTAYSVILTNWVLAQGKYFRDASQRNKDRYGLSSNRSKYLMYFGMFVINPIMVISHYTKFAGDNIDNAILVALPVVFVAAVAIDYYSDRMMFDDNFKHYVVMGSLFTNVKSYLDRKSEKIMNNNVREVLFELGKEALAESGNWMQMHRERALEVPKL